MLAECLELCSHRLVSKTHKASCHVTLQKAGYSDSVGAFHDRVKIGPKMLTRIARHTAVDGRGFAIPPDRPSTSLWKSALGFLRIVWMNFRVHEFFGGNLRRLSRCGGSTSGAGCLRSVVDGHHPHNGCNHGRGRVGRESPPVAPLSPLFHGF